MKSNRWRVAAAVIFGCVVSACSMPMADLPGIGVPENTPPRPAVPTPYLAVHDVPPPRSETVLDPKQQAKIADDLVSLRKRQESENPKAKDAKASGNLKVSAKPKPAKKPDAEVEQ